MKNLFTLFLVLAVFYVRANQMPIDTSAMRTMADTIRSENNSEKLIDSTIKSDENKSQDSKSVISSWKLYTIMLAFPVILIVIFVLVYIRGKR